MNFDFTKIAESFGSMLIVMCQIVFGAVIVRALFGDGSEGERIGLAVGLMVSFAAVGLCCRGLSKKEK